MLRPNPNANVVQYDPVTGALGGNVNLRRKSLDYFPIVAVFPGWNPADGGGPFPLAPWSVIPNNRVPLIGKYDERSQAVVDYQLELMRDFGIRGVCVLMYFKNAGLEPYLNHFLDRYMTSTVRDKPKLVLMWVVQTNAGIYNAANFPTLIQKFLPYYRDPNYLKIDGKPAMMIFDVSVFRQRMGNTDGQVVTAVNQLKTACVPEFGGCYTVAMNSDSSAFWMNTISAHGVWDAVTTYTVFFKFANGADTAQTYPAQTQAQQYNRLAEAIYSNDALGTEAGQTTATFHSWFGNAGFPRPAVFSQGALTSSGWAGTSVPEIWAPIATGWAPKPWNPSDTFDASPTDAQFEAHLLNARSAIDAYYGTKTKRGICFVTAWNEFGEGQYIMPTAGQGYSRLEAIRAVFGG